MHAFLIPMCQLFLCKCTVAIACKHIAKREHKMECASYVLTKLKGGEKFNSLLRQVINAY